MRIAHWSLFAPSQSGMYHTTRDMVEAQRELGIESEFICMNSVDTKQRDGAFWTGTRAFCNIADLYILHSRIDPPFWGDGTPIVFIAHGQPSYTWQTELYGLETGNPAPWSTSLYYFTAPEVSRVVTFWKDQLPYWQELDGVRYEERVRYVPRGIRFGDRWQPQGDSIALTGEPVLVIADSLRMCKDWVAILFGAARFARKYPKAQLHLFGIPEVGSRIGDTIRKTTEHTSLRRILGSVNPITHDLEKAFRGADILLSAVRGESRVVIEAAACGVDVVTQSCEGTWEADFRNPDAIAQTISMVWEERLAEGPERRERLATQTRDLYDMRRTAEGLKVVYEELV